MARTTIDRPAVAGLSAEQDQHARRLAEQAPPLTAAQTKRLRSLLNLSTKAAR